MSMKNTLAHGSNWHLYENFGTIGGVYLQVDNSTLFLNKEMMKEIYRVFRRLERHDWELVGEGEVSEQHLESLIDMLQKAKENRQQQVPESDRSNLEGTVGQETFKQYQCQDWLPEDEDDND